MVLKCLFILLNIMLDFGRTEATLERHEVNELKTIAEAKAGFASVQADNILRFFYGTIVNSYYPALPNYVTTPRLAQVPDKEETIVSNSQLWAYPNPAINWADLVYQLPEGIEKGTLIITAISGQQIANYQLTNNKGIVNLNTQDWAGGLYFAALRSENTQPVHYKIVVRK